jgi:hypothetical protein
VGQACVDLVSGRRYERLPHTIVLLPLESVVLALIAGSKSSDKDFRSKTDDEALVGGALRKLRTIKSDDMDEAS